MQIGDRERRCRLETGGNADWRKMEEVQTVDRCKIRTSDREEVQTVDGERGADWRRGEKCRLETGGGDADLT